MFSDDSILLKLRQKLEKDDHVEHFVLYLLNAVTPFANRNMVQMLLKTSVLLCG